MKLLDIMTSPWAIIPEKLREIRAIYETHMRGEKLDLKGLQNARKNALISEISADDPRGYTIDRGVAIIPITDVLTKNRTFFSYLFGANSMRDIRDAFRAALEDRDVHSILLRVDSPGGTVDGTEELANIIYAGRGVKPVVAFADGMMASAAYWIGAAADRIYIAGDTTEVGGIGVVAAHIDISKADEMAGERWTEITAGRYKRLTSAHRPLSEEGRRYLQEQVDEIYRVFVESVAGYRGLSVEQVLDAADGKIYLGQAAIENGLVDGMAALDDIIENLKEENDMTYEDFKAKHPDLYRAAYEEGRMIGASEAQEAIRAAAFAAGKAEGLTEGAAAERERLTGMDAHLIQGNEALLRECKEDPKCTVADFLTRQTKAEQARRQEELTKIKQDAISPVAPAVPPLPGVTAAHEEHLPLEQRAKLEWDRSPDLRAEFSENFEHYLAYRKNEDRVRILGRKN